MFSDRPEFEQCREEVELFRRQTREYLLCLKAEVGAALDHFNNTIDLFNQRTRLTDKHSQIKPAAKEEIY